MWPPEQCFLQSFLTFVVDQYYMLPTNVLDGADSRSAFAKLMTVRMPLSCCLK